MRGNFGEFINQPAFVNGSVGELRLLLIGSDNFPTIVAWNQPQLSSRSPPTIHVTRKGIPYSFTHNK
jgi:hypothetical protein